MASGDDASAVILVASYSLPGSAQDASTSITASWNLPPTATAAETVLVVTYRPGDPADRDISGQLDVDRPLVGNFARQRKVQIPDPPWWLQ